MQCRIELAKGLVPTTNPPEWLVLEQPTRGASIPEPAAISGNPLHIWRDDANCFRAVTTHLMEKTEPL